MMIRQAEIVAAQVRSLNGGSVFMSDSVARELPFGTREIVAAVNGGNLILSRSRLERFTEIDSRETPVLVEDCLLEGFFIDGLDIKGTNVPLVVRGTTLRYASPTNSNADALDFGPGPAMVERCLIHDFPDKGVSIGGASGTTVQNTLIYRCGIGISAYASSNVVLVNNTVTESAEGILFRDNPQPAMGTATNLIVWGNTNNVVITNTSSLTIAFSDVEGTIFPGPGNISSDPLFVNAAGHDYRLGPGSPALGSGAGGVNMGAPFPIGGIPAKPLRLAALVPATNHILLTWMDDAENEDGVLVQRSTDALPWQTVGVVAANATSYQDFTVSQDQAYYYRVRATNGAGVSAYSNPTRAVLPGPVSFAGGTLTGNTIWSGTVQVTNTVTIPTPFTLVISAGTNVRLTNGVSITASGGGHLEVNGTAEQPVSFDRVNTSFTRWGDLAASGASSTVSVRHALITHGRVRASSGGTALVEDSELSQMTSTGIIGGSGGALFTVRRCYVHDYEDIDLVNTRTLAEDSLFERARSDIFELQNSPSGSVLRHCTFRNCLNPNSDGVDMNGCIGVLIDSCLIYNVTDKGISSGSATSASDPTSFGLVVSNTLVHTANIGIGIKDSGTASLFQNTISATTDGVAAYAKFTPQGGFVTNGANNIIWGVTNSVRATNDGTVTIVFSDLQHTNWPGAGNFSADPLFLNAAAFDYRLAAGSPARYAGHDGQDVGAYFPVGAPQALSHPRIESVVLANGLLSVKFWADSEKAYTLSGAAALEGASWATLTNVPTRAAPVLIEATTPAGPGNKFLRLQTP
jgi:parallel beta-helix repeat protein